MGLDVRVLLTLTLVIAILSGGLRQSWAQPVNVEAAKKEGKVVIYGTIVPQVMNVIQKGFEAKYGIKTEYWRADATKVIERAMTEWRAGRPAYDVVTGARGALILGKQEGIFGKYVPPASEAFPAKFKDPDGQLTAWRSTPIGILYNTELVKPADAPKSLDDLLDPKWHGKLVIPDPTRHNSTAQFLWNLEKIKGERWMDFVRALGKQKPNLIDSFAPIPTALIRGESHVGITYIQYVAQQKGPIGYSLMAKALSEPTDAAISAKAANPNAGKLLIDYICSPQNQKKVAESGEFVLQPGVYPTLRDAEKVVAQIVFMDNPSTEQLQKLKNDFRPIFLGN